MSFLDDAKDALGKVEDLAKEHPDQVKAAVDKAQDLISGQTGGKYDDQIAKAADKLDGFLGGGSAPAAETPAQ